LEKLSVSHLPELRDSLIPQSTKTTGCAFYPHKTAMSRAADAHMQAAAQVDRAKGSAEEALHEIQDVSRGMREANPEKALPSESEMDEIERAAEKDRQAQQHSAGW
jgi:hypothetical protein